MAVATTVKVNERTRYSQYYNTGSNPKKITIGAKLESQVKPSRPTRNCGGFINNTVAAEIGGGVK